MHGVKEHRAIGFAMPRGTPILAAADGWYVATYAEAAIKEEDGSPKMLSLADARRLNTSNPDLNPPEPGDGPWSVYFGSYVIQGWHGRGRYIQYAHIDYAIESIPYYPSVVSENSGNYYHHPVLQAPVTGYKKPGVAVFIRQGEVIGWAGSTGCGCGRRCIDDAIMTSGGRPDFRQVNYTYYDGPHLHFMVFGRRAAKTRKPIATWDPFGLYG